MTTRSLIRMFTRPNLLLAIVGVVAGGIGAAAAERLVQDRARATETELRARYVPRQVVVAARNLSVGQQLDANMLALRQMPTDFLPAGTISAGQVTSLIGRRLAVDMTRGDPLQSSFATTRAGTQLATLIRPGARAVTISVDSTNSMSGLVNPGDIVDLYYSRITGGEAVLLPLLEHVEVLAAGDEVMRLGIEGEGHAFGTLTILVSPEDAARVVLAQGSGTLTVLMRSRDDDGPAEVVTRSSRGLFVQRHGPGALRPGNDYIEVIVGGTGAVVPDVSRMAVGGNRSQRTGERT